MNQTYAYSSYDRKIKFRMVSAQHFINEAPGEVLCQMNTKEFGALYNLHRGAVDVQRKMVGM